MKKIPLANAFSKVLNDWIPEKLFEVNARNKEASYIESGCCATHDFCDPNEAIIQAFKTCFGFEPSVQNKKHNAIILAAWNLARANNFKQIIKKEPCTLVKFYKETESEILAVFPQLNYSKPLYGNTQKTGYSHIGQHTAVHVDYIKLLKPAKFEDYNQLHHELIAQGYANLKILNR